MEVGLLEPKAADADMLSDLPDPEVMGPWLSDADLDFYVNEFTNSTFRGPLNYYRNHNLTWQLTEGAPTHIKQPAMFVAGDKDGVIVMAAQALQDMPEYLTDLRINELIADVGHWTQQEAPDEVNKHMLSFLQGLS
jgi:pimeloyl-ACP methyl ester carboxylesterase